MHALINTKAYIEKYLKIRDKGARIISLRLNAPQMKLYSALKTQAEAGLPQRAVILKARQMGFSTLTEAVLFKNVATGRNVRAGIVAHKETATANLFNMSRLFYDRLPREVKPAIRASNARELVFKDTGSSIRCMTAGGDGIGRSDTFQKLHVSEYAFWRGDKKATLLGLLQSVPNRPETLVVIESTANGCDDFKDIWDRACRGESGFAPVFCAWWELPEYRARYDGFVPDDAEMEMIASYGLDMEQITWRRWCIGTNCGGDADLFRQEYPGNPHEAFISSGRCVFSQEAIARRISALRPPVRIGQFRWEGSIGASVWENDPRGCVKIYREPARHRPYVMGGDTAGDGSDFFVGQVLDNTTGEQAAVLRMHGDEDEFARQAACLGAMYNHALIGIEANFSTFPIRELARLGYGWQYVREHLDSYTGRTQKRWGFKTTAATRPVAIAGLISFAREHMDLLHDRDTLAEMMSFVRNDAGRPEAARGAHDDCVMALAIAHKIREQQSYEDLRPEIRDEDEVPWDRQVEKFVGWGR